MELWIQVDSRFLAYEYGDLMELRAGFPWRCRSDARWYSPHVAFHAAGKTFGLLREGDKNKAFSVQPSHRLSLVVN